MSEIAVEDVAVVSTTSVVFHAREGALELHLTILAGVAEPYRVLRGLRTYSQRPTGVFHALPISQGKSIVNSHWIRDMVGFTVWRSSLPRLSNHQSTRCSSRPGRSARPQQLAAEAFGSRQTFFVTNGTSTANKIVAQALLAGDIVLVDLVVTSRTITG